MKIKMYEIFYLSFCYYLIKIMTHSRQNIQDALLFVGVRVVGESCSKSYVSNLVLRRESMGPLA